MFIDWDCFGVEQQLLVKGENLAYASRLKEASKKLPANRDRKISISETSHSKNLKPKTKNFRLTTLKQNSISLGFLFFQTLPHPFSPNINHG